LGRPVLDFLFLGDDGLRGIDGTGLVLVGELVAGFGRREDLGGGVALLFGLVDASGGEVVLLVVEDGGGGVHFGGVDDSELARGHLDSFHCWR
jgi:hypothetical protein